MMKSSTLEKDKKCKIRCKKSIQSKKKKTDDSTVKDITNLFRQKKKKAVRDRIIRDEQ